MLELIDAHAHIHEADFPFAPTETLVNARENGVNVVITVGTNVADSRVASDFASENKDVYALVGIHPGESVDGTVQELEEIIEQNPKVVGLGDVGLDYHYGESENTPEEQKSLLRELLKLAVQKDLPVSFHVRDAFSDFWSVLDEFDGQVRGVLHSFTDNEENLQEGLKRGLFIGVNGIATFAREVREVVRKCPLERVILETDAPWLTPVPLRGQQNQPANVLEVAKFLAKLYNRDVSEVAKITTENTKNLFKI